MSRPEPMSNSVDPNPCWFDADWDHVNPSRPRPMLSRVSPDPCRAKSTRAHFEQIRPMSMWIWVDPRPCRSKSTQVDVDLSRPWPMSNRVGPCPCWSSWLGTMSIRVGPDRHITLHNALQSSTTIHFGFATYHTLQNHRDRVLPPTHCHLTRIEEASPVLALKHARQRWPPSLLYVLQHRRWVWVRLQP